MVKSSEGKVEVRALGWRHEMVISAEELSKKSAGYLAGSKESGSKESGIEVDSF